MYTQVQNVGAKFYASQEQNNQSWSHDHRVHIREASRVLYSPTERTYLAIHWLTHLASKWCKCRSSIRNILWVLPRNVQFGKLPRVIYFHARSFLWRLMYTNTTQHNTRIYTPYTQCHCNHLWPPQYQAPHPHPPPPRSGQHCHLGHAQNQMRKKCTPMSNLSCQPG